MIIEEPWVSWLVLLARICLAGVFLVSGVHKALWYQKAVAEFQMARFPMAILLRSRRSWPPMRQKQCTLMVAATVKMASASAASREYTPVTNAIPPSRCRAMVNGRNKLITGTLAI